MVAPREGLLTPVSLRRAHKTYTPKRERHSIVRKGLHALNPPGRTRLSMDKRVRCHNRGAYTGIAKVVLV